MWCKLHGEAGVFADIDEVTRDVNRKGLRSGLAAYPKSFIQENLLSRRKVSYLSKPCPMIEPANVGLFTGLKRNEISAILVAATRRQCNESETIVNANDRATHLFIVRTGNVDYEVLTSSGKEILLWRLVPGDVFGVAAFLSEPIGYLGTAKSVCQSEVLVWKHKVVQVLSKTYPRLPENALRTALRYIALHAERHMRLVTDTAQERLAIALTSLGSRAGRVLPTGLEIDIKNEDLASLADLSFFTATRLLKAWERKGAVKKSRGKILVRCPEKLLAA
jgi:CRP-like cAMP-binding protein